MEVTSEPPSNLRREIVSKKGKEKVKEREKSRVMEREKEKEHKTESESKQDEPVWGTKEAVAAFDEGHARRVQKGEKRKQKAASVFSFGDDGDGQQVRKRVAIRKKSADK